MQYRDAAGVFGHERRLPPWTAPFSHPGGPSPWTHAPGVPSALAGRENVDSNVVSSEEEGFCFAVLQSGALGVFLHLSILPVLVFISRISFWRKSCRNYSYACRPARRTGRLTPVSSAPGPCNCLLPVRRERWVVDAEQSRILYPWSWGRSRADSVAFGASLRACSSFWFVCKRWAGRAPLSAHRLRLFSAYVVRRATPWMATRNAPKGFRNKIRGAPGE
jgi:hypothetical protein